MYNHTRKNYLRTYRKKLGLNQRQLAFILGLKSSARISAMEQGQAIPTARESIAFRLIFGESFEELWPRLAIEVEAATVANIRRMITRLGGRNIRSARKRIRINIIRKNLAEILIHCQRNDLANGA